MCAHVICVCLRYVLISGQSREMEDHIIFTCFTNPIISSELKPLREYWFISASKQCHLWCNYVNIHFECSENLMNACYFFRNKILSLTGPFTEAETQVKAVLNYKRKRNYLMVYVFLFLGLIRYSFYSKHIYLGINSVSLLSSVLQFTSPIFIQFTLHSIYLPWWIGKQELFSGQPFVILQESLSSHLRIVWTIGKRMRQWSISDDWVACCMLIIQIHKLCRYGHEAPPLALPG